MGLIGTYRRRAGVCLSIAAVAFAALALVPLATAQSAQPTRMSAATIQVKAGEFHFKLSKQSAPRGKVTFVVTNDGTLTHDFSIGGKKTRLLQPGQTARLVVTFSKKGKYPYLCTVPGHAAAGMKGVFTIA
jgi:uncharacterized cupredoxin-like copper-binding protein